MFRVTPRNVATALPSAGRSLSSINSPGFFELRQYDIRPDGLKPYLDHTKEAAPIRSKIFNTDGARWLGFWTTEMGGNLNRVHHLYHYRDYDTRDKVRAASANSSEWGAYLKQARPHVEAQQSAAFVEAGALMANSMLPGALAFKPPSKKEGSGQVAYEMRVYQLKLGYSRVPDFLKLYGEGLPDKMRVDQTGESTLVSLLYSDSGSMNKVIELWRHQSMQGNINSRIASREAAKWKLAVAGIADEAISFETITLRPTPFSEWN